MDILSSKRIMELIDKAVKILRAYGATEVYLFGSAREKDFAPEYSDIDLAVRGIVPEKFYDAAGEILCSLDREVDIIDLDAETSFCKYLIKHKELSRVA